MKLAVILSCFCLTIANFSASAQVYTDDDENTLLLTTKYGTTIIRMYTVLAPRHIKRIKELVRSGYYKGSTFHRVIGGFIAQTGDPSGVNKGSGKKLRAEFSYQEHVRGTVSMARYSDINSADDQFFIVYKRSPHLDRKYTIFGTVISGMEFIDLITAGDPATGHVEKPTKIISMWIGTDAAKVHNKPKKKKTE